MHVGVTTARGRGCIFYPLSIVVKRLLFLLLRRLVDIHYLHGWLSGWLAVPPFVVVPSRNFSATAAALFLVQKLGGKI